MEKEKIARGVGEEKPETENSVTAKPEAAKYETKNPAAKPETEKGKTEGHETENQETKKQKRENEKVNRNPEKKPGMRRAGLWALILALCAAGIFAITFLIRREKEPETVTLHFLMFGDEPEGMAEVLDEFYRRTHDSLGIRIEMDWIGSGGSDYRTMSDVRLSSRADYDLVFDAEWVHLNEMQEKGIYADLSPYLNNPDYPGLQGAFSEIVLENNLVNGEQCALPIFRTYGSGIPCIYYRKDLASAYGIGSVDSLEDLEAYLQALLREEPDMIPLVLNGNRGFYSFRPGAYILDAAQGERIVYPITIEGVTVVAQLDETSTKVEAVGIMGDEESFSGFMEGLQFDFLIQNLEGYRQWNRYCEEDVLNRRYQEIVFQTGDGGAFIATLDDYEEVSSQLARNVAGASLGVYIINERAKNMEEQAIATNYQANNYVCVPASSTHMEKTMKFLDWLFSDRENHDLFEYGIEGIHWRAAGEDRYEEISDEDGGCYSFPGYALTWNPHYVRFPSDMPEDILAYKEYEMRESTFYRNRLAGFSFDQTPVQNQMRKAEQIIEQVWPALSNGLLEEPAEVLRDTMREVKRNGLDEILEELQRQLQDYLDRESQRQ